MDVTDFIHDLTWDDVPEQVRHQAKRCLLDTVGVAAGGRQTDTSRIIYDHVARFFGGKGGILWFDGREVSLPGVVLAHGMSIDSLDMHDSCRPVKGHAGLAQIPAALATGGLDESGDISGEELLTTLAMAYDIAIRTGTAQHATVCDYHTSGSWNAVGCAAIVARRMGLSREETRHALGIAEYHGPRSQMMRNIDHPTMLKDGSGWGAMAGVSAGLLAADGFSGAPAITVESDEVAEYWDDLGERWSVDDPVFQTLRSLLLGPAGHCRGPANPETTWGEGGRHHRHPGPYLPRSHTVGDARTPGLRRGSVQPAFPAGSGACAWQARTRGAQRRGTAESVGPTFVQDGRVDRGRGPRCTFPGRTSSQASRSRRRMGPDTTRASPSLCGIYQTPQQMKTYR